MNNAEDLIMRDGFSGDEFDRVERRAMACAKAYGFTDDDEHELEVLSRLFHGAAWPTEYTSTAFSPSSARVIVELLERAAAT